VRTQKKVEKDEKRVRCCKTRVKIIALALVTSVSLTACSLPSVITDGQSSNRDGQGDRTSVNKDNASGKEYIDTGFVLAGPDSFDSADTPIIVDIDRDDNTVTFLNLEVSRKYTLSMDGTTQLYDKYGESISLNQIKKGNIVDIKFLKSKKHLTTLQLSPKAWNYDNVERYEINTIRQEVTIGEEVYKLSDNTQYLSGGRNIEGMELNASDVLSFQGIDKEILCVSVEKGHGYLRLANDENFIGGWIEIGQSLIKRITEDMLLTVPEGSYQVNISCNGSGGIKNVVINRNEETTLDIGDLKIAEPKYGSILFSVTPSTTQIYIDGTQIDASQPVSLEYGIHQLIAKASGYQSITRYLRVGDASAGIDIVLDKVKTEEEESSESTKEEETDTSTKTEAVTDYYKVYIDAPTDVEVYLDGNYVGITPCNFRKEAGTHVITLRKTDYETKSYTVQFSDEKKDFSYSFVDLIKKAESGESSASGETGES